MYKKRFRKKRKQLSKRKPFKSFISYKYIIIIFLLLSFIFVNVNQTIFFKSESGLFTLLNENFSELSIIEEIKDKKDRKLYLKNKTEFYIQKRTDILLQSHIIYNESNLITFQDKLNYLIIHESPEYKSFLADKIKVREYSKLVLGKDICVPILKIYNDINEINFDELPDKFVLKLNHGSNMNIICNDKSKLNIKESLKTLQNWKNMNYGFIGNEFQYLYIKRKIFAETFLGDDLIDYKIFCFNGNPKFIRIRKIINRNDSNPIKIHNHYDPNWKLNELESGLEDYIRDPNIIIEKPKKLGLMLKYARLLSQEFVFVRVDLYEVNGKVYLGELTFSPSNSFVPWKNKEQSIQVAKLMDINKIKNYLFNK